MSLLAIRAELLKRLSEEKAYYDRLLQNAAKLCQEGLSENGEVDPEVYIEGASNIVVKPDFSDTVQMRELLLVFEEKSRLIKILNECVERATQDVTIRIGAENTLPSLHSCALITSIYGYGDQGTGRLGIVGPVRMEYARTIGVVHYVARLLERALTDRPN
jgi:heat-inducible transcriptional repressor